MSRSRRRGMACCHIAELAAPPRVRSGRSLAMGEAAKGAVGGRRAVFKDARAPTPPILGNSDRLLNGRRSSEHGGAGLAGTSPARWKLRPCLAIPHQKLRLQLKQNPELRRCRGTLLGQMQEGLLEVGQTPPQRTSLCSPIRAPGLRRCPFIPASA
jgi:hypothetical protein